MKTVLLTVAIGLAFVVTGMIASHEDHRQVNTTHPEEQIAVR